jgi:signal transduction histidine kinase
VTPSGGHQATSEKRFAALPLLCCVTADNGDCIEPGARSQGGEAVFAVADPGCGIPEADLERIFARFARASA